MKPTSKKSVKRHPFHGIKGVTGGLILLLILSAICVFFGCQPSDKPGPAAPTDAIDLIGDADSVIQFNGAGAGILVDGETESSENRYTFTDTLTITMNTLLDTEFNRYTLGYFSDSYLQGTIFYTQADADYQEDFFLEAGENASFSSLIDGYLEELTGTKISKIELRLINTESATFGLTQIDTAVWELQEDAAAYLENERFKIGVNLLWGGGLSYLEDKNDGDPDVTNMLNSHDTGRLVQQSYYGTQSKPYVPAAFNGSTWAYNPVQGGDQYGYKSKLVDFEITTNSIYVKCRPLDWAQENMYTFSYMENVYTLERDYILVNNRFVDFSTYNHGGEREQEVPAFYTISYLDTFTYYKGKNPWTNDELTVKEDLPDWAYNPNSYFSFARGNTETWCAWTSSEKGYGLGLYTPDVSGLKAGRFKVGNSVGSKEASANSTNYVAPLIQASMQNCKPFEYSYLITAGTVDTIRSVFQNNRDKVSMAKTSETLDIDFANLVFDSKDKLTVFSLTNGCEITQEDGAAKFTVNEFAGNDPYAFLNYTKGSEILYTDQYKYIAFTYMVPKTNQKSAYTAELFLCTGERMNAAAGYSLNFNLICDGEYHTHIIDLTKLKKLWPTTAEPVNGIRIDFFSAAETGDVFYLSELLLKATKE